MLDHPTLSASQGSLAYSATYSLKDTDETPIVVTDLSASAGSLHKNSLHMRDTGQDRLDMASSVAMSKMAESGYPWQEKEAARFFLYIGQLRLLEQRYTLRERDEVLQLLEKYPQLSLLLLAIYRQILPYFPGAQVFLKAVADAEATDDFDAADDNENLVISIVTHMQPRLALDRLKQFYKDWWLKVPGRAKVKEKISFNLECV
jgi:hypothetical protein